MSGFLPEHVWKPLSDSRSNYNRCGYSITRRLKVKHPVNIAEIMEQNGFKTEIEHSSNLMKFIHEDFKVEFLTDAGAKSDENIYRFKSLNLTAQELHFMNIPLRYNFILPFRDIKIRLPEPEAFALHKLIISYRRKSPIKREMDLATARGLFEYFNGKPKHIQRLNEIFNEFPKGWKIKIETALKFQELDFPS